MAKECWKARLHVAFWGLERCGSYQRQLASLPGSTPLIVAAVQGHKGLVKSLLESRSALRSHSIDVDDVDDVDLRGCGAPRGERPGRYGGDAGPGGTAS